MWWSRAFLVVLLAVLGLSGCGFRPLYGERAEQISPTATELAQVRVGAIEDRIGQQLRNALVQRINPRGETGAARFALDVRLSETTSGVTSDRTGGAALGNKTVNATFTLTELAADQPKTVFRGLARSITSYRYFGPRYGTVATERDAEERAVVEVADNIRNQLSAYFASQAAGFKPGVAR